MKKMSLEIENLKCGGCETSIKMALQKLIGVGQIDIDGNKSLVLIEYDESLFSSEAAIKKLASMGYPQKGTGNNFQKAKSYVSCAVGKTNNAR